MSRSSYAVAVLLAALALFHAGLGMRAWKPTLLTPTPAATTVCLPEGPPLRERPKHNYDYRLGGRHFDGGIV